MLDKTKARAIARDFSDEVRKLLSPSKIILFGSHINGTPHEWSDIDVAVLVNDYKGDWIDMKTKLFSLKWDNKFIDIEPHLLDETHDPSGFVEHIVKTGEIIFNLTGDNK
ncbi:MAG: nucleotidyltransferase domain-containing protein [Oscillospiraceae bacterium]|nr:nucleotidyltransferase domain-containing protein [Oscillospiraceae bacterium]